MSATALAAPGPLGQLRAHAKSLPAKFTERVQHPLQRPGCSKSFWRLDNLETQINRSVQPPFGTNAKMLQPREGDTA